MKKTYQIGLRLPENVYFIFEAEAKKTGENIASIARKKIGAGFRPLLDRGFRLEESEAFLFFLQEKDVSRCI